jgi:hypothetical protein
MKSSPKTPQDHGAANRSPLLIIKRQRKQGGMIMSGADPVPIEGLWKFTSRRGERLEIASAIAAIVGVLLMVIGGKPDQAWALVLGIALLGLAAQVFRLLTLFKAWRDESRHQVVALMSQRESSDES